MASTPAVAIAPFSVSARTADVNRAAVDYSEDVPSSTEQLVQVCKQKIIMLKRNGLWQPALTVKPLLLTAIARYVAERSS